MPPQTLARVPTFTFGSIDAVAQRVEFGYYAGPKFTPAPVPVRDFHTVPMSRPNTPVGEIILPSNLSMKAATLRDVERETEVDEMEEIEEEKGETETEAEVKAEAEAEFDSDEVDEFAAIVKAFPKPPTGKTGVRKVRGIHTFTLRPAEFPLRRTESCPVAPPPSPTLAHFTDGAVKSVDQPLALDEIVSRLRDSTIGETKNGPSLKRAATAPELDFRGQARLRCEVTGLEYDEVQTVWPVLM